MFDVRQEKGSPFFTGFFQAPDGKSSEFSTKSVFRSVAQQIVMCWVILSLAARNRIMTKRQFMEVPHAWGELLPGLHVLHVLRTIPTCVGRTHK